MIMSKTNIPHRLPHYDAFMESIAILALPLSGSELHGVMCGYLCAGAMDQGEAYLRTLMLQTHDSGERSAMLSIFSMYAISQQQLMHLGFDFQLLLPDENEPLFNRAQAFSEWCDGFIQSLTRVGVDYHQLDDEDTEEAIQHLSEFAQLDCDSIQVDSTDEEAFMEVCEYARMAVLHIHSDLHLKTLKQEETKTTH
jgi:uncharacterized protein YgfB (UPF0149 family)